MSPLMPVLPPAVWQAAAITLHQRATQLATASEEPGQITRRAYTPAMQAAQDIVRGWMQSAGMQVSRDAMGNLSGHYPAATPDARTLLLGSHLDTVRDAGKYDGILGVLVAIAVVQQLADHQIRLPFHIEVIAFIDEEGARFHTAYLGSAALAGSLTAADLARCDDDGMTLADAVRSFGGDPAQLATLRRAPATLLGYCEVHIEQGPVLEAHDLPLGIVTAIAGQTRIAATLHGQAGHAGTVPMHLRHDALCGAAELVLAVEACARATPDLVATVGRLHLHPDVSNVIPAAVTLSIDVRHQQDAQRRQSCTLLHEQTQHICTTRHLDLTWDVIHETPATPCDPHLSGVLADALAQGGYPLLHLPSGAGHDAVALAPITPVAMLFVRCAGGVSHHPAEAVQLADVAAALDAVYRFVLRLANGTPNQSMQGATHGIA